MALSQQTSRSTALSYPSTTKPANIKKEPRVKETPPLFINLDSDEDEPSQPVLRVKSEQQETKLNSMMPFDHPEDQAESDASRKRKALTIRVRAPAMVRHGHSDLAASDDDDNEYDPSESYESSDSQFDEPLAKRRRQTSTPTTRLTTPSTSSNVPMSPRSSLFDKMASASHSKGSMKPPSAAKSTAQELKKLREELKIIKRKRTSERKELQRLRPIVKERDATIANITTKFAQEEAALRNQALLDTARQRHEVNQLKTQLANHEQQHDKQQGLHDPKQSVASGTDAAAAAAAQDQKIKALETKLAKGALIYKQTKTEKSALETKVLSLGSDLEQANVHVRDFTEFKEMLAEKETDLRRLRDVIDALGVPQDQLKDILNHFRKGKTIKEAIAMTISSSSSSGTSSSEGHGSTISESLNRAGKALAVPSVSESTSASASSKRVDSATLTTSATSLNGNCEGQHLTSTTAQAKRIFPPPVIDNNTTTTTPTQDSKTSKTQDKNDCATQ